jgi:hypothetical protein
MHVALRVHAATVVLITAMHGELAAPRAPLSPSPGWTTQSTTEHYRVKSDEIKAPYFTIHKPENKHMERTNDLTRQGTNQQRNELLIEP